MRNWLVGKPENALKQGYLWNMIASGINASEAILILMVATRTVGLTHSGILTIAFTVANLMMCIGKYGVRNFQVTDSNNEYHFHDYYVSRIITLFLMLFFGVGYLLCSIAFRGYSNEKALIVLLVIIIYGIEAYEDVFLSALQHDGRLDIGTRMFSLRWVLTLTMWMGGLVLIRDTLIATLCAALVDLILVIVLTNMVKTEIKGNYLSDSDNHRWKEILYKCYPICVAAFLSIYLPNAAKYAIDSRLEDQFQAYYGFISMPVFVIDLLSVIIFQPMLVQMSEDWNKFRFTQFKERIQRLCLLILGLSVCVMIGSYLVGIPFLSLLYGVSLNDYKTEFMLLMLGGVSLGYIGLFTSVLIIIRRQKYLMTMYLLVSATALLMLNRVISEYRLFGAAVANMSLLLFLGSLLAIGTICFIVNEVRKHAG